MVEQWVPLEISGSTMVNHGHFITQPWQEVVNNGITIVGHGPAMVFSKGQYSPGLFLQRMEP